MPATSHAPDPRPSVRRGDAGRAHYLDGLRGLAIFIVMGWHYLGPTYAAWLPYGDDLGWIPVFNRGWVGVFLFFLISGYVIFMTLERCHSLAEFLKRRWLRLFPAMLIASLLLFLVSQFLGEHMPGGRARPLDMLPGLSFVSPSFWHAAFHVDVSSLDGVFWTLYVEVAFYVIFGLLYFRLGGLGAIAGLVALWLAVLAAPSLIALLPHTPWTRLIEPFQWIGVQHYGWFASGALFFKAHGFQSRRLFACASAIAIASALTFTEGTAIDLLSRIALVACVIVFAAAQASSAIRRLLEARALLFLGFVSYPLYLIHNELGIGLLGLMATCLPTQLLLLLPLLVMTAMLGLAWIIAAHLEPWLRHILASQTLHSIKKK